jgi:serine phosphatase RsbU (regulator of sigma subunit)
VTEAGARAPEIVGCQFADTGASGRFGDARLEQLLVASTAGTPGQFVDDIVAELRGWVGSDRHLQDDVTVVVVDVVQ